MLILARKSGEVIRIGDDIVLTVIEVRGRRVRVGIDAPAHVRIRRDECPEKTLEFELETAAAGEFSAGAW